MFELVRVVAAAAAGGVLGVCFFGSLWWTTRRGLVSAHAVRWFLGGTVLRMAGAVGGIYVIGAHDPYRLLASVAGFTLSRIVVVRWTRSPRGEAHAA